MGGMGAAHAGRGVDFIRGLGACDSGTLYHDAGLCGSPVSVTQPVAFLQLIWAVSIGAVFLVNPLILM